MRLSVKGRIESWGQKAGICAVFGLLFLRLRPYSFVPNPYPYFVGLCWTRIWLDAFSRRSLDLWLALRTHCVHDGEEQREVLLLSLRAGYRMGCEDFRGEGGKIKEVGIPWGETQVQSLHIRPFMGLSLAWTQHLISFPCMFLRWSHFITICTNHWNEDPGMLI